jgi:ribosomal protein L12E/L44/L45/RPP1/RPP2
MDEGEELDDDTILRLVLLGIRNLGPAAPLPVAEPPDPSASEAGDKKSKKDKKKEEKKKEDGKKDGKKVGCRP